MLSGAFLCQDLISESSNMGGSVLSLEGKDKEEFLYFRAEDAPVAA